MFPPSELVNLRQLTRSDAELNGLAVFAVYENLSTDDRGSSRSP
jgi:hypothetical protein